MALTLPAGSGFQSCVPRPITARHEMRPATNGPVSRTLRPGSRTAWDIVMHPMTYEEHLAWRAVLLDESETVLLPIPQPGIAITSPGATIRVNGANQWGRTLNADGFTASHALKAGRWLSFPGPTRMHAYELRADVTANGSGQAPLPLLTMIRVPPADNAIINLMTPVAECWATVDPESLEVRGDQTVWLRWTAEEVE